MPNMHDYPIHRDRAGFMPHDETMRLITLYQSDPENNQRAKTQVVQGNISLVRSIAEGYYESATQGYLDYCQEGVIGLDRAVRKFDTTMGYQFSTYATYWIEQAIGHSIEWKSRSVRLPSHVCAHQQQIRKFVAKGKAANPGYSPTPKEIAKGIGASEAQVNRALSNARSVFSLDNPIGDGESTMLDVVQGNSVNSLDALSQAQTVTYLESALATVKPLEREILLHAIGIGRPKLSLVQCSALYDRVGTRYAAQHRDKALCHLRKIVDRDAIGW